MDISILHKALVAILADIKLCRQYAKQARANKEYKAWSHWMNVIKRKKADLTIVAKWLHIALHAKGKIKALPLLTMRQEQTTVEDICAVVARTAPQSVILTPML